MTTGWSARLTPDTVRRFVAVHEVIVAKLGPRFNEIAATQDDMLRREQAEHRKSTSTEDFNKAIVAPFLPKLKESAALAFFGL